jgi:ribosomal protein S18 acetylase RimI-like enzyme
MNIRNAETSEIDELARVWHDAWHDGHGDLVPDKLKQLRTNENFRERIEKMLPHVRTAGRVGQPLGLCLVEGDELKELFVSAAARGTGLADKLIADGEDLLFSNGIRTAWLGCLVGNDRAARFYERSGWIRAKQFIDSVEIPGGIVELNVWRYEKELS